VQAMIILTGAAVVLLISAWQVGTHVHARVGLARARA